ncbi:MAG TPA: SDR family NAD(P)-dependent oxidoreductase [Geminicoccaceae bacterium]|jgi:NAD(P)-dependent dehydrogenase (short-subunit alcohol dehydrogenase family)|nr:SDR family NAD(P)-dependent oxidoreductase [Geminicoccaceae bacterium]
MTHPVLTAGRVAVVTGAAMGIGLAACKRFATLGLRVAMADVLVDELRSARDEVARLAPGGERDVLAVPTDVARPQDLESLKEAVWATFGAVGLLMNNAATRVGGGAFARLEDWQDALDVNFWGVVHGVRAFVPRMIERGEPGLVVNTGSKQGITNPPGNLAYNVTKSALKTYTEGLQHELRNTEGCRITAHLLVPGWTTTGRREHKPGAWLPEQVIDHMLAALERGDFYIVCPDDETPPEMDKKRILWSAGDITENRPPLSRWHPDYAGEFMAFSA